MSSALIIGDIHGCFDELQDLLDCAGLADDDQVIALGDIVDRGPASPAVYHYFRDHPGRHNLMGNHERKHVRWQAGLVRPALSQRITRYQLGDEWPEAVHWMAGLPRYLDLPEALLVHGLFEPGAPLAEQQERVLTGTLSGEAYLRAQGYRRPWHELYQGDKPLIVGHQNLTGTTEPYVRTDQLVYGLDTGCATGGKLTGLLLPGFKIIAVPSRGHHWSRVQAEFGPRVASPPPVHKLTFSDLDRLLAAGAAAADSPEQYESWQQLRAEAEAAIQVIQEHVKTEHERILALLAADSGSESSDQSFARRYDEQITNRHLRPLLHQWRKAEWGGAQVRQHLGKTSNAIALAERLGRQSAS